MSSWIPFRHPASNLRGLVLGKPQITFVLLFHNLDDMRYIGLPFCRPGQTRSRISLTCSLVMAR
jgi:hypothetical protein